LVLLAISVVAIACLLPGAAAADPCRSLNDGGMIFPDIQGPEDPEEYCFEVILSEEQELVQIDDRTVQVMLTGGHPSFTITAKEASDADGATVPTTLAKTGRNEVTLTVHHREGNPAMGGVPFDYPVVGGPGWEGGFISEEIKGPLDESELKVQPLPPPAEEVPPAAPTCEVPDLVDRTLNSARRALHRAGCRLGSVHGHRHPGARIVKQYRPAYTVRPAGAAVGVKLGR